MGFGSYDESEQQNQQVTDDSEAEMENFHEHTHNGELSFDSDASTDELLDKLEEIKAQSDDE